METRKSQDILDQYVRQISTLLDRQRVVEHVVHAQPGARQDLVEALVHRQHLAEIGSRLGRLHPADIAYVLENLPPEERAIAWEQVRDAYGGEVLVELSDAVRPLLIAETPREALLTALRQLDADDVTYLAEELPEDVLHEHLQSLPADERNWLESSMTFPEGSVGALMSNIMVTVRETDTLDQVQAQVRALEELPLHTDKLFVLDRRGSFRGTLALTALLRHPPQTPVGEVMATDVVRFGIDDRAADAAQAFERYDLISAPVLNERGKLAGRLTVDVMMDYLREQRSDELLRLAGLARGEDLFTSIWGGARNRWQWLMLNLVTAFVASRIIGAFESSIAQLVALAALMPIVASVGGNTGNQTTAIVIRAISMGQHTRANMLQLARKELGVALLNGVMLGLVVAVFALLFYHNVLLGAVIAAAMLLNLVLAASLGLAVPMTLHAVGRDPALGSSVLLTAATDSMGFFIFLGLATLVLL